jgi:hypothetical protein
MKQKNKKCINENALLDINVSDVFVVKSSKKRAFIEQFNYSSVNFTQKNLGTILGFFIVRDESEASENIVNFLASEVKKKYFSPTESSVEDKFESTLHHINRALEEIANIGNVQWLGTIDSVICVIADSTIHFSVTGNAHILLLRDGDLINISEGIASTDATEYPLKTFVDISSGDISLNDKIIITSHELLELVSFEDLQKNALNFTQEDFLQFIETVLANECSMATTTVIDINQIAEVDIKMDTTTSTTEIDNTNKNFFGANTFDTIKNENDLDTEINVEDLPAENPTEYTDPRTGHIHIQGNSEPIAEQTFKEKLHEKWEDFSEASRSTSKKYHASISKKISNFRNAQNQENAQEKLSDSTIESTENSISNTYSDTNSSPKSSRIKQNINQINNIPTDNTNMIRKICIVTKNATKTTSVHCLRIFTKLKNKSRKENLQQTDKTVPIDVNINQTFQSDVQKNSLSKRTFLPSFHHIKQLWSKMDTKTKSIALGILIAIILIPLFFTILSKSDDSKEVTTETEQLTNISDITESATQTVPNISSNIIEISDPEILLSNDSIVSTLFMNKKQIGILKDELRILTDSKTDAYKIPTDAGNIKFATNMDDLDLIFFITTKNKIYSFSPTTKDIKEQHNIPEIDFTKISTLSAYLTYLYTTDAKMIKRYARQENGFTQGEDWLNKSIDLSNTTTLAIDAAIYTAANGKISKFTKHTKDSFTQDDSIKKAYLIYVTPTTKNMWVLDKENSILFKTTKDSGEKIEEFKHHYFNKATSLTVQENKNIITISTDNEILSFNL